MSLQAYAHKRLSWLTRIARFFCERVPEASCRRWYHGYAYWDWRTRERTGVIWPLHHAVHLAWWLNLQWCRYLGRRPWMDLHANRARAVLGPHYVEAFRSHLTVTRQALNDIRAACPDSEAARIAEQALLVTRNWEDIV